MSPNCTSTVAWSHAICSWYRRSPRMLTMAVNGMRRYFPVGGIPGILASQYRSERQHRYSQPVDLFVMCKAKDELVDNPINAHGSADELKGCIIGVVEYEMIQIEFTQPSSADSSCQLPGSASLMAHPQYIPSGYGSHMAPAP